MSDLLTPMMPLLLIGLFCWSLHLSLGMTVLFQTAFTVLAIISCFVVEAVQDYLDRF